MISIKHQLTLQEFLNLPEEDITYELVNGEAKPKMSPKRFHSRLTIALCIILTQWAENKGEVGVEWAVILKKRGKDWVPVPDLLYISYARFSSDVIENEACPIPPDLVIEIISPDQSFGEMSAKASDYLDADVMRVWVIDPKSKTVTIFYPDVRLQTKRGTDSLEDALFPGLVISAEQIFNQAGIP